MLFYRILLIDLCLCVAEDAPDTLLKVGGGAAMNYLLLIGVGVFSSASGALLLVVFSILRTGRQKFRKISG